MVYNSLKSSVPDKGDRFFLALSYSLYIPGKPKTNTCNSKNTFSCYYL